MTLTGQHQGSQRETCSTATLCISHPTWTGLRLNLGLQGGRLVTKYRSHCMVLKMYPSTLSIAVKKCRRLRPDLMTQSCRN